MTTDVNDMIVGMGQKIGLGSTHRHISYAQRGEDRRLWDLIGEKSDGHYIDVGAWHPETDSVSKSFYDAGWRGINIEPLPDMARQLQLAQPESSTLNVALSDAPGVATLRTDESRSGLSTLDEKNARNGRLHAHLPVMLRTLADVCEQFVSWEIDWLKIDVEGWEAQVIRGADWNAYRPRFVVVEATLPRSDIPSHTEWQPLLFEAGYELIDFDGLNRFYQRGL